MGFGIVCKHCGALEGAHTASNKPWHSAVKRGYRMSCAECPGYERLY